MRWAWIVPMLALAGCFGRPRLYPCSADADCNDGVGGVCQGPDGCAYEDLGCESGLRLDDHAPGGPRCVEPPGNTGAMVDPSSTTALDDPTTDSSGDDDTGVACGALGEACCEPDTCDGDAATCWCTCDEHALVAAGSGSSCVIEESGAIYCWGDTDQAVLGPSATPVRIPALEGRTITQVDLAQAFCVVADGEVLCWGANNNGQVNPDAKGTMYAELPAEVELTSRLDGAVEYVATGSLRSCAASGNDVVCWGIPLLAPPMAEPVLSEPYDLGAPVLGISAGRAHVCAIVDRDPHDEVRCWGDNESGQLGDGSLLAQADPATVVQAEGPMNTAVEFEPDALIDIQSGANHTCVLSQGGTVYCWGDNSNAQLTGPKPATLPAARAVSNVEAASLSVGLGHACVVTQGGLLMCWGDNSSGQLNGVAGGLALQPAQFSPREVTMFRRVGAGGRHTCASSLDGELFCWGDNTGSALGHAAGREPAVEVFAPLPEVCD